jgi:hypothetical protein
VVSKNVRNEVNFAINHEKPFLAVHLQETALPRGLELRMGDIQAIMKYRMPDAQYRRKLYKSLPPGLCAFPAGQVVAPGSAEASGSVFCNSLGNRLVQVPDAYLAASARPGGALFVASTVVSHRDYLAFVDDGGPEPWSLDGHPHATVWQGRHCPDRWLDHPVVWVAHSDALAFCEWLTRKETPRDKGRYVLPAFEQWTALARTARLTPDAVTDRPWSEGPPTAQVAADEPGFLGLHHLLGNVFEWCSDTETREGESYALTVGGGWASSRTWLRECIHHQTFGAIWCPRGWPIQDGGFRLWYVRPETRKGWFGKR